MDELSTDHSTNNVYGISIDRKSAAPLVQQLVESLRAAIRAGRLAGATRLMSTRDLARELGLSRSVTVAAYEQLEAEGYLEGKVGAGTRIVEGLEASAGGPGAKGPVVLGAAALGDASPENASGGGSAFRRRSFYRPWVDEELINFDGASGSPELGLFPREEWGRCLSLAARGRADSGYGIGEVAGNRSLRRAIADYLFRMKGLSCAEEEIIVTSGASQAAVLLGAFLRDGYPAIQVEDPSYPPLRATLRRQGLRLLPIAIDGSGLVPESVDGELPLLATPAHHFPTGALLPAERREAIAARARSGGSIIVEDDYDGELRLKGLPIRPLRAIAPDRAILMGSFSKVMYPGLRLGYLAAPELLMDRLLGIKYGLALWADGLAQAALARFIDEGRLDRRVRRIKRDCAVKRELVEELAAGLPGGPVRVSGESCGMHCALAFPGGLPAPFGRSRTAAAGFVASPLASFSILPDAGREEALLIGYGNLDEPRLREGFRRIGAYIEASAAGR